MNKDILVKIALILDNSDLYNYGLLSKRFNTSILNNEIFWMNKLNNVYGLNISKFDTTWKKMYKYFTLAKPNDILMYAINNSDIDLIKLSFLGRPNFLEIYDEISVCSEKLKTIKNLLAQATIKYMEEIVCKNEDEVILLYPVIIDVLQILNVDNIYKIYVFLYDNFLPKHYSMNVSSRSIQLSIDQLERLTDINPEIFAPIYEKRMPELLSLLSIQASK